MNVEDNQQVYYSTQVIGEKKERPDIVAVNSNGEEKIICEVKFFAGLTENQPNGYLDRLTKEDNAGLVFICPESRVVGLWQQLNTLVSHRDVQKISDSCVKVSGVHMSIIDWNELLDVLQASAQLDSAVKEDVHQLIGYCKEIENTEFVPFKSEDFGIDVAKRIDRYNMVVDSAADLLLKKKEYNPSKKGLRATPQWDGYTRGVKLADYYATIYYSTYLWKKETSYNTPFWLSLYNSNWKQDEKMKAYLQSLPFRMTERGTTGHIYIALEITPGRTLPETAEEVANTVLTHIDELNGISTFIDSVSSIK